MSFKIMARGIDLLEPKKRISVGKQRLFRFLKIGSIVLLIGYSLGIIGVFLLQAYFHQQGQKVAQEIEFKKKKIAQLKKIESLQVILKQRLSFLKELLEQKSLDYQTLLSYFQTISSGGVSLDDIRLSRSEKIILSGKATDALSLTNFLKKLRYEKEGLFSTVILSSTARQEDGSYKFNLSLEVGENGRKEY